MLLPEKDAPTPFTWAALKEFCNGLTDEQLKQTVILPQDESSIEIKYASSLGEDQYNFIEEEYSCTKESFDPDMFDVPTTFEEALVRFDYSITPGTNVYLFDE
ncbi:MAG: hypothetical protein JWQ09_5801 [Segetibacter sp.]|nr:hypothetical protein [Segetibacter sp.]